MLLSLTLCHSGGDDDDATAELTSEETRPLRVVLEDVR
jgi:hypothetical protein